MYEANKTLWIGNLSPEVDEELLFELFVQVGPVDKVTIAKGANKSSKGYGFVDFKHESSAVYAMALMNGISLYGRRILPQQRVTNDGIPNHKKRASLQDRRIAPYQSPRHPHPTMNANASQVYHIPVLDACAMQATYRGNVMGQDISEVQSPACYIVQDFKRRRTQHGLDLNVNNHYGIESPFNPPITPQNNPFNIVLCDHRVHKNPSKLKRDFEKKPFANGKLGVSTHNLQGRPFCNIYDRRKMLKKYR